MMLTIEESFRKCLQEKQDLEYENENLRRHNHNLRRVKNDLKDQNSSLRKELKQTQDWLRDCRQRNTELKSHNQLLEAYSPYNGLDKAYAVVKKAKTIQDAIYNLDRMRSWNASFIKYSEYEIIKKKNEDNL